MDKPLNKRRVTVCLVDDDALLLRATGRLLSGEGWRVETFVDPHEFLAYAETYRPKVAVVDIIMPTMNGLDVQGRLRAVSPTTQVIVLTSKQDPSVRSRAMQAGASAFFTKPVADTVFLAGIETAASRSR